MKFTLSWLKEHLETDASVDDIAETLTDLGLEVEDVSDPARRLRGFSLGRVIEARPHPDADRLRVCRVATDRGERQIVCGAPNARDGITVVVAHPGAYVPGIETTLAVAKVRGVESHGMMVSEREMQLSDEHDGIIELPSGEVGEDFADWLAAHDPGRVDPVFDIAITPNRPDALGVRGVARDLAARGMGRLKPLETPPVEGRFASPISVAIDDDAGDGCPLFAGRVIRGVRNGPSPAWLQKRLTAVGLRPISALVDITNYFTIGLNRPLHVFDAEKVSGGLRVHRAVGGEMLAALDERTYTFRAGDMVISDDGGAESIAGIMGGEATGVTGATSDVFLESAYWDPVTIARTGRALKVQSDARYRFERGVDPAFTIPGLEAATAMILDLCGGEPSEIVVAGAVPATSRSYRLDPGRTASLVGLDIPEATQRHVLEALGFTLDGEMAMPPSWRPDVQGEADLVEEVARIVSLTRLEPAPMRRPRPGVPKPVLTPMQRRERTVRRTLAAAGMNECVTYSFIDEAAARLFGGGDESTRLDNPISSEMTHMRPALLPGLLQAAARNQARGFGDLALFEVGAAFHGGEPEEQHLQAAGVRLGESAPRGPHGERRPVDLYDARADAEATLAAIGAPAAQILRGAAGGWHPGRHGMICLGPKKVLGVYGELHPRVVTALGVRGRAVGFTLFLDEVPFPRAAATTRAPLALADLQPVSRDFAFVVDAEVEAQTLVQAARGADKALIEEAWVFDEFAGGRAEAQVGAGRKSLALTVRLQPREKTLTEAEIEAVSARIIDKITKATGGTLRG
jgi:phenylalanyl-tRNA synthetase beta chain